MGSSKADPSQPEVHQAAEFELQAQQFQYQQVGVEVTNDGGNNASNYDQKQQPQPPNIPQNDPQGQGGQQQVLFHHHHQQQQQPPQTQPIRYTMPPQGTQPNLYQAQQPRPVQIPPPQSPQSPINPNGLNQPQPQFQAQNYPPQSAQFQAQGQQFPPQSPQFQAQQTYQPPQMNQPRPVQMSPQIQKMRTNPMYPNGPNNQPAMGAQPSPAKFSSLQHQNGIGGGGGMPPNYIHDNQAAHQQQNYPAQGVPVQTHNNQQAGPNNMTDKQIGNGGWNSGLFDCMEDPMNALITAFVPCLTFGQIAEIVDNGTTSCATSGFLYGLIGGLIGVPCIMSCTYRTKLRSRYGLMESPAPDWVTHFLCEWCALCQEYRELQHRGLDPSIGWLGNVERNDQQQANVMVPPMNQNMMA